MKVIQVDINYVKNHLSDNNIYRILVCNDGRHSTGSSHYSMRVKPLGNITVDELNTDSPDTAYVVIDTNGTIFDIQR